MIYHNINPAIVDFEYLQIRYYGLFYAFGFLIVLYLLSTQLTSSLET